jgi:hypothetical protein
MIWFQFRYASVFTSESDNWIVGPVFDSIHEMAEHAEWWIDEITVDEAKDRIKRGEVLVFHGDRGSRYFGALTSADVQELQAA